MATTTQDEFTSIAIGIASKAGRIMYEGGGGVEPWEKGREGEGRGGDTSHQAYIK